MSRRPPSARDPRNVGVTRTIPAVNRSTKGASASRLASPLSRPLRGSQPVTAGGGDSTHPGTGADSTAVGAGATASGDESTTVGKDAAGSGLQGTAFGSYAWAQGAQSTALGQQAYAASDYATAVGNQAVADAQKAIAIGRGTSAHGARSFAVGFGASTSTDDAGIIKIDSLELSPSSGGSESALILHDSSGARWKVTVDTTGHLTTTAL